MARFPFAALILLMALLACALPGGTQTDESSLDDVTEEPTDAAIPDTATPPETPAADINAANASEDATATPTPVSVAEERDAAESSGLDDQADPKKFPVPTYAPTGTKQGDTPLEGEWTAINEAGFFECPGMMELDLPAQQPEAGEIVILEPGETFHATGIADLSDTGTTATMLFTANPAVPGRYDGDFKMSQDGVDLTIQYYALLISDDYMVGYLESEFDMGGTSCEAFRTFHMFYGVEEE